ncbi:MAG: hypothetical protein ACXADO_03340 [Candidatus Thorarchaeota archaeon]|jgi:hypothetical protein
MRSIPLQQNTVALTTFAMLAALGIVVRMFVRIPVIPGLLDITPGFLFSELGGVIGGLPGGALVGAVVGLGGAMAGGEPPLLPMIGNICLGIGTGYAIHLRSDRDSTLYVTMVVLGGGIIGGFIPSMTIFATVTESIEITLLLATIDMLQAFLWAFVALLIERALIRPLVGHYLYPEMDSHDLQIKREEQ